VLQEVRWRIAIIRLFLRVLLAWRWGLSTGKSVEKAEADPKQLFPRESWNKLHLQIIYFGRTYCPARGHKREQCPICSLYGRRGV
jgi:endonuclease-3